MLDKDLAELYQVETRRINEQVKRNITRFSSDFMFQLNEEEFSTLTSQIATSSWGGTRKLPCTLHKNKTQNPKMEFCVLFVKFWSNGQNLLACDIAFTEATRLI